MKRILLVLLLATPVFAYDALQRSTELQFWNPGKAQNGYTFFGVGGVTYLIDMEGRVVHTWPIGNNPHLLDNGNVLDASTNDPSGFGGFKEVDWSGNTIWQYTDKRTTYHPHHDFTRIFNPKLNAYTTLYIANRDFTAAECIAAGANPAQVPATGAQMDALVEVDQSGTVVWEWCFFDHLVQDFDATKPNHVGAGKTIASYPGRLNINLTGHPLKGDWLHCNSVDFNQKLDQIVVNSVQGEFYVIDHGGTFVAGSPTASIANAAGAAGDFLYRFGDPARYAQGTTPAVLADWTQSTTGNKQLGGAHDVQWIGAGLAGEGHFLIFNNGQYLSEHTPQSYVMEIDGYLGADGTSAGHYVNPPDAGYYTQTFPAVTDKTPRLISRQVVSNYYTKSNLTLFSHIGCSAQRLPNGNTLICADTYGYIMEVTAAGETVWDYIMPVVRPGTVLTIGDSLPMTLSIFRAYRYTSTHPALLGRTLTPGKTIAGRTTVLNPYAGSTTYEALQRPTGLQYLDSAKAYAGYTLLAAGGTSWLLDLQGRVVRTWSLGTNPRLLENGHLLDAATSATGASGFKELDWDGKVAWEYYETRSGYQPRSDFVRIFDPKLNAAATLYIASKNLTHAQCIAAGCNPANGPYDGAQTDVIVEVDLSGSVVWEWSFFDHAVQDIDATKLNHVGTGKTVASFPGRINLNLPGRPVRSSWPNCNALDYNQALDQIVINSEQGEFYVINHGGTMVAGNPVASVARAATSTGDFLYRFGDPARYGQGSAPSVKVNWEDATSGNKQIGASNNVQWIKSGLPGAGHFLVFNNNQYLFQRTAQSYAFEINPYLDASGTDTGAYVNPPTAGYTTWSFSNDTHKSSQLLSKQVVWKYGSVGNLTLFSHRGSSVQRLPNGNTLICATTEGYLVEVTSTGDVVWEFINPVTATGVVTAIGDNLPMTNAVPRAYRYAPDFAGLVGRDLTPQGTIETYAAATAPVITTQPSSQAVINGASTTLSLAAQSSGPLLTYQWRKGGRSIANATGSTLTLSAVAPADAGIYDAIVSGGTNVVSQPVVVGVLPASGSRTAGAVTTKSEWQVIQHPNGNLYDQFLLSGQAGTFSAAAGRVARMSFLDTMGSIVQVEMSGSGAVTVVLDATAALSTPLLYNQADIQYMQGQATIVLAGADATTHLTVYSVGTMTNPGVTRSGVSYPGWAVIVATGIVSASGQFGGLHQGDVLYVAVEGRTGVCAPSVSSVAQSPVVVHNVAAADAAAPCLYFNPLAAIPVKIAGGNLLQSNGAAITVSGVQQVLMGAGQDSCGTAAPAQLNKAKLINSASTDVTTLLVAGP